MKTNMVGPQDGGFGFDQSKKYTTVDNLDEICVQCQAGQQDRKSTRLNSSHSQQSRMPSSA